MRTRLVLILFAGALFGLAAVPVTGAVALTVDRAVMVSGMQGPTLQPVHYWHGRYYRYYHRGHYYHYRYRGRYYNHRHYRHGHWHYY